MEDVSILFLCLVPAALLGVILTGGEKLLDLLLTHCKPLREWHDREVRRMEEWQEDDSYDTHQEI